MGSFWPALISLAVVPLYLKYLGIEAYGLIGFSLAMQAVMQLLDLGLSATISREVARAAAVDDLASCRNLLKTFATIYWGMAVLLGAVLVAAAPWIAHFWLNAETISPEAVSRSVALMGIVIAARWPTGLYLGALTGAERLVTANAILVVMSTVASLGAVAVIALLSPTVEAFFVWQAIAGMAQALVMRTAAWRTVGRSAETTFNVAELQRVWRFSAGVSGIALSGILFTQLDKIILSRILSLSDFGAYVLAWTIAGLLYRLISPVYNVVFPRFSSLYAAGRQLELTELYRSGTDIFAGLLFPVAMAMIIAAEAAVSIWTGNPVLAKQIAPLIGVFAIGSSLHGMMYFPYALQLAYGEVKLALQINLALSVVIIPLILLLSTTYGALGGALSWLVLHSLYLFFGSWVTHRRLLTGIWSAWLISDVGRPLVATIAVGGVTWAFIAWLQPGPVTVVLLTCGALVAAMGLTHLISSRTFADIKALLKSSLPVPAPGKADHAGL